MRLSTGEIGRVAYTNGDAFEGPVVSVLVFVEEQACAEPRVRDLLQEKDMRIESFVQGNPSIGAAVGF